MNDCRWSTTLGLLVLTTLLMGCSGREYDVAPVAGQITLDGQPLAEATVSFEPLAAAGRPNPGPGSYGKTDADGRFGLFTAKPEMKGAVVGTHVVRIRQGSSRVDPARDDYTPAVKSQLPKRCHDGSLRFEVSPGGTNEADFALTSGE